MYTINELQRIISPIASQHGIEKVFLFGSYAKGTSTLNSDIDIKIEKGNLVTLFQLSSFRLALEDELKQKVDVVTNEVNDPDFLNAISKDEVLIYERA